MPTNKNKFTLILILVIAVLLRFWQINTLPSLNPDEAALGYNAYSLLKTGKDEHGISWPLHFKSFSDYKPGGYVYLALPFIKIFGLTPLAVRLPNLILSVLTIFVLHRLVLLLTKNYSLSNFTAFVLAVNPWHIHFSRGAWESSVAVFFIVLGIYFFYKFLEKPKSRYVFFFPLSFIASIYVYHSARIIAPLIVLTLFIIYSKKILHYLSIKLIISIILALLLAIPVLYSLLNGGGATRLSGVGLTADTGPISRSKELLNHHSQVNLYQKVIHNQRVLYFLSFSQKYFSHFDLNFLFVDGDAVPRSGSPEMGQLYLIELPFLLYGIYSFIRSIKIDKEIKYFLIAYLLISPLASSMTFQAPSALRSLSLVIPISIFTAFGLYKTSHYLSTYLVLFLYLVSCLYFIDAYFTHSPQRYSFAWNRGFSEIVPLIEKEKNNYENIYFTDKYDQPYILYLFFSRYDPVKIQAQINPTPPDKFGFSTVRQIDNIHFYIPENIPQNSLVIDADDFEKSGQSFKIYTKL